MLVNNMDEVYYITVAFPYFCAGDQWGRAILGGGSLFGIGSLCFYGLGLSGEMGAIDKAR